MKAVVFSTTKCIWCDRVATMLKDAKIEVDKVYNTPDGGLVKAFKDSQGKIQFKEII